jgi:hypothetical protein
MIPAAKRLETLATRQLAGGTPRHQPDYRATIHPTGAAMADDDVLSNIQELATEEHGLLERHHAGEALSEDEHRRLEDVQVRLDQCWDLLRQRRARRQYGEDPKAAKARDEGTVEGYWQ